MFVRIIAAEMSGTSSTTVVGKIIVDFLVLLNTKLGIWKDL